MAKKPASRVVRLEDRLLAAMSGRSRRDESYLALVAEAIDAYRVEPMAFQVLVLAELLEEQAEILSTLARFDEALVAMREAVAEGLDGRRTLVVGSRRS